MERALRLGKRFVERRVRRVGAVGHHDQTGERQTGQLVARALERRTKPRRRARRTSCRAALFSRSAEVEKRKKRSTNRFDERVEQGAGLVAPN